MRISLRLRPVARPAMLRRDRRGTVLVEFAVMLPVMLVLWMGSLQIEDGIACNRKVTIATRAVADLVAQNVSGSVAASDLDSNLAAATQVLAPYPAGAASIRITEVTTDATLKTTVQWSRGYNAVAAVPGQVVTIPVAMRIPGAYFLFAEVTYAYKPPMNFGFVGPLKLGDSLYMLPRNSNKIDCTGC
ncbi:MULTISPECIES: TadE/TadG family type IV pilus assembly protein [unclassified Sphingomonas]|jgi:Flp pilus assembly protein TadG|uniref:TadE/TadG family type IV pilus assembly protein n=1 Tax=unclassified Sphingomonas TaxID=196159 RepID=UPI001E559825|nr:MULTISPECIES: TadE/TadG family type IV pilus assembly protein [unclassified Sphingomonas]